MLGFFVAPGVAGDHGDAEDLNLRGLEESHHGHLVGAAGAGAVLVDEDEARGLRRCGQGCEKQQQEGDAGHGRKGSTGG